MIATICLLAFLAVAAVMDWRWGIIPNKLVYPGIMLALGLNSVFSLVGMLQSPEDETNIAGRVDWGLIGLGGSLGGLLVCGGVMLFCFALFAGQVGGGDVKLLAMVGAWWGVSRGLEAMLWTLVIGGAIALISLVWQVGVWKLIGRIWIAIRAAWRMGGRVTPDPEDKRVLQTPLRLAPSAVLAVLIVHFRWLNWW